jgi:hypothetical protein
MQMDVVVVLGTKDKAFFETVSLPSILNYVQDVQCVYVISSAANFVHHPLVKNIDEAIFHFTFDQVCEYTSTVRGGWYFQQLLKLHAHEYCPVTNYVIIDSDVVFLQPVTFFEGNIPLLNVGTEYHLPYFEHSARVHPSLTKTSSHSGICHLFPLTRDLATNFLNYIDSPETPVWRKLLEHVDAENKTRSGMSEYEMWFTYLIINHMDKIKINPLQWKNVDRPTQGNIDTEYYRTVKGCHYIGVHLYLS